MNPDQTSLHRIRGNRTEDAFTERFDPPFPNGGARCPSSSTPSPKCRTWCTGGFSLKPRSATSRRAASSPNFSFNKTDAWLIKFFGKNVGISIISLSPVVEIEDGPYTFTARKSPLFHRTKRKKKTKKISSLKILKKNHTAVRPSDFYTGGFIRILSRRSH